MPLRPRRNCIHSHRERFGVTHVRGPLNSGPEEELPFASALERRIEASTNAGVVDFAGAAPVPARRFRETHQERKQAHRALLSSARRS